MVCAKVGTKDGPVPTPSHFFLTSTSPLHQSSSSLVTLIALRATDHHTSSSLRILDLTQSQSILLSQARKTVSRKARKLPLKSRLELPFLPTFERLFSGDKRIAVQPPATAPLTLVPSCSCRHPTSSRVRQSTYEPRAFQVS